MKEHRVSKEIKSGYLANDNLEGFLDLFIKVAAEDNKKPRRQYKNEPEFSYSLGNGYQFSCSGRDKFIKTFRQTDIPKLKTLSFNYYGFDTTMSLDYRRGLMESIGYRIETNDQNSLIINETKIKELIGSGNINWIFHEMWTLFLMWLISLLVVFALIGFYFGKETLRSLTFFPEYLLINTALWSALYFLPNRLYPRLIISRDQKKLGRDLKEDLWKIGGIFMGIIILPSAWEWLKNFPGRK